MMRGWIHRATLAALAASLVMPALAPSPVAAEETIIRVGGGEQQARFLSLGRGKSVVVELPRDAKDVLVANPGVANAVVRSARRAFLIGVDYGQTTVVFFDNDGRQIAGFDIEVGRDAAGVQNALRRLIPNAQIKADQVQDSVVLSGTVASAEDAAQAAEVAGKLVGDPKKVVNGLTIKSKEQVMLKVVVAEVERSIIKQFGVNLEALNGGLSIGQSVLDFATLAPFGIAGQNLVDTNRTIAGSSAGSGFYPTIRSGSNAVKAVVNAMEQAGVMRTLAEPNLSAVSGEAAKFLAGGEFPVVVGWTSTNGYQVEWKPFGVLLNFTPVVLSEGRISLRMSTEVSELDPVNGVKLGNLINIPGIKTRRASSTIELPSGGSLVMAGLIKETNKQAIDGTPGLMNVPVLGTLFRSRDFQAGQTELMIIVTPYVVNPVARTQLQTPDEGFAPASDPSTILLGRINRIYGVAGKIDPTRPYHGTYGFIID
jgi:pilus assembly protein CpaC